MPSRLNYISKRKSNNKSYYLSLKYPEIPLSINDTYIITTVGDRLDTLANQFYGDSTLWWYIANANNLNKINLEPGTSLRIPRNTEDAGGN